jgi:hypothetical protein
MITPATFPAANWTDSTGRGPGFDWLGGQGPSLYFAAGHDQISKGVDLGISGITLKTSSPSNTNRLVSPMRELERDSIPSSLSPNHLVVASGAAAVAPQSGERLSA